MSDHTGFGYDDDPHRERYSNQMIRGHLTAYWKDKKGRVRWDIQSRQGASYQDIEIMVPSGYMAAPKIGDDVEVLIMDMNGDHSHLVAMPIGNSTKWIRLEEGESAMYNPENPAQYVKMRTDGRIIAHTDQNIVVKSTGGRILLDAPVINSTVPITLAAGEDL